MTDQLSRPPGGGDGARTPAQTHCADIACAHRKDYHGVAGCMYGKCRCAAFVDLVPAPSAEAGEAVNRRCGSQGVDSDGNCLRCGLRPDGNESLESDAIECPPGFFASPRAGEATTGALTDRQRDTLTRFLASPTHYDGEEAVREAVQVLLAASRPAWQTCRECRLGSLYTGATDYRCAAHDSGRTAALIERVAIAIYDAMREHDPVGSRVPWVRGGNSDKQDEARRRARAALSTEPPP